MEVKLKRLESINEEILVYYDSVCVWYKCQDVLRLLKIDWRGIPDLKKKNLVESDYCVIEFDNGGGKQKTVFLSFKAILKLVLQKGFKDIESDTLDFLSDNINKLNNNFLLDLKQIENA